jgi:small subunit ribosomal protein S6
LFCFFEQVIVYQEISIFAAHFKIIVVIEMNQYEITFIVDPVLSGDEIVATAQTYVDLLQNEGCKIVHVDEIGLRSLAYPLGKRTTGIYFCIEFKSESGSLLEKTELALRRDERIMRFLTVKLDKYGIKYNEDKRNGLIGKKRLPKVSVEEINEVVVEDVVAPEIIPLVTAAASEEEE